MFNNIILSVMAWTTNTVGYFAGKFREEHGQDILEYAVIAGGIAIVALVAVLAVRDSFDVFADKVAACVSFNQFGPEDCSDGF